MRKLLTLFLFAALPGAALAADMRPAPKPIVATPVAASCQWCGLYIGANVGYLFNSTLNPTFATLAEELSNLNPKGLIYGAHLGYNTQVGLFVVGVETDFTFAGINKTQALTTLEVPTALGADLDYFGSARVRAGFLPFSGALLYGTGGLGWGHTQGNLVVEGASFSAPALHFGWVAGGGLEVVLVDNWTGRLEYLHYDLGKSTYSFATPFVFPSASGRFAADTVRAGLSYKFGH